MTQRSFVKLYGETYFVNFSGKFPRTASADGVLNCCKENDFIPQTASADGVLNSCKETDFVSS